MVHQDRAIATRNQIIGGAAQVFDAVGFAGASLERIVHIAGTTRGALYFHFRTKEGLASAVIEEQHRISIGLVEAISASEAPAVEQIVMLCHEMACQILDHPVVRAGIRLTMEMTFTEGPADPYVGWIGACTALVERGIDQGDIVDTVVPAELARFVVASFTGIQLVSLVLTGRSDLVRRVDEMWVHLLPSIVPPARRRKIPKIRAARWRDHD